MSGGGSGDVGGGLWALATLAPCKRDGGDSPRSSPGLPLAPLPSPASPHLVKATAVTLKISSHHRRGLDAFP